MFLRKLIKFYKKCLPYFLAAAILAGAGFYVFADKKMQSYTASAMIEGTFPDGTELETSEIKSSEVISRVCDKLELNDNIDSIRSAINVEPVLDEEEQAMYLAMLEHAEEYKVTDKIFMITFSSDVSKGKNYPKKVLDEVLQEYFRYFGENHCSQAGGVNDINDIYKKDYDYLEMTDVIETSLDETLESLNNKIEKSDGFRVAENGYSFSDLYSEFQYIRDVELPRIAANILSNGVSKDKDVLISKYERKNSEIDMENTVSEEEIEKLKTVIDSYVKMMSSSQNVYANKDVDKDYILDDVYDRDDNKKGDKTTSYDKLLTKYVSSKCNVSFNEIESAYNDYIIGIYKKAGEATEEQKNEVEKEIEKITEEINTLHDLYMAVNDEYNECLGAKNLSVLSSVAVNKSISVKKYTIMFAAAIFFVEMLIGVVLFRLVDIFKNEGKINEKENIDSGTGDKDV